jgi:hypothetical protein
VEVSSSEHSKEGATTEAPDYDPDDSKDKDPGPEAPGATEDPAKTTTLSPEAQAEAEAAAELEETAHTALANLKADDFSDPRSLLQALRGDDDAVNAVAAAGGEVGNEVAEALKDEKAAEAEAEKTEKLERIDDDGSNLQALQTDPPAASTTEIPTGEAPEDQVLDAAVAETNAEAAADMKDKQQQDKDEAARAAQDAEAKADSEKTETPAEKQADRAEQGAAFVELSNRMFGGSDASADDAADLGLFETEDSVPKGNGLSDDAVDIARVRRLPNEPQMEIDKSLAQAVGLAESDAKRVTKQ